MLTFLTHVHESLLALLARPLRIDMIPGRSAGFRAAGLAHSRKPRSLLTERRSPVIELVCGYCACCGDDLCGVRGCRVVKELLRGIGKLCTFLGYQYERTLYFVSAVLYGRFTCCYAVNRYSLYGTLSAAREA